MALDVRIASLVALTPLLCSACPEAEAEGGARDAGLEVNDGALGREAGNELGGRDASASGDGGAGGGEETESCGYWVTVHTGCSGDSSYRETAHGVRCMEGVSFAECRSHVPEDEDTETRTCFRTELHDYWMFRGDCEDWDAYWNREANCLIDRHCDGYDANETACVGGTCMCDGEPCPESIAMPSSGDAGIDGAASPEGGVTVGDGGGSTAPEGGAVTVGDGGATQPEGGASTGGSSGGEPDGGVTTPSPTTGGSSGGATGSTPVDPGASGTTP